VKFIHTMAILFSLAVFVSALAPSVRADAWNEKTTVTFSEPVEIPGPVLGAVTYFFKMLDNTSNRDIVQIFNKDENHLYATILAVPDYRLTPAGKTVITFEERKAGSSEALRAWFYPGDNYGQEFVYPKARAIELAKQTEQHVLAMPNNLEGDTKQPATSVSEPHVAEMKQAPVTAIEPGGQEVTLAQVHPPALRQAGAPSQASLPKRLPKTASLLPFWRCRGSFSLAAAAGVPILTKGIP
jgi:hypothetical protein